MSRAREKYEKVFGARPNRHPDVETISPKGLKVKFSWDKKHREYRAWKWEKGGWVEMKLGSLFPESLQEHIEKYY